MIIIKKIINRIKHLFGYHKYFYIRQLSGGFHLVGCEFCKKKFAVSTSEKFLIEWDPGLEYCFNRIDTKFQKAENDLKNEGNHE